MKNAINTLGILILTLMIISVPILCTCSYLLNWDSFIKLISSLLTVLEMIGIGEILYVKVESEE